MSAFTLTGSWKKWCFFILITALIAVPLFYHACIHPLFLFDESYYYIASYKLGEHGHFFIDFDPSSYLKNTKPYLFVFAQILTCKFFGWNEWALRLPTVLAAITLIWALIRFVLKRFHSLPWALASGFTLLVAPFFIGPHMAFTGDHDIPLTLFTTLFILHLYNYTSSEDKTSLHLFLCCLYAALSILTKGWMILFFLPSSFLYLLWSKKLFPLFRSKGFGIGITVAFILISAWYTCRELLDPGYLKAVWEYEIGRYAEKKHSVHPEWTYYWKLIAVRQLGIWLLPLIMTCLFIWRTPPSKEKKFLIYLFIQASSFLMLLSFSNVKLDWYNAPALTLIVLLSGFGLSYLLEITTSFFQNKRLLIACVFLTGLFALPYYQLFQRTFDRLYREAYGDFMVSKQTNTPYTIVQSEYNPTVLFYAEKSRNKYQINHPVKTAPASYSPGEMVLICEPVIMLELNRTYEYEKVDSMQSCILIQIKKERL